MKIEWNKVTWYSKLIAVILFVVVFYFGFSLGKEAGEIVPTIPVQIPVVKPINTVSYSCDAGKTIVAAFYQGVAKPVAAGDMPIPTGSVVLKLSDGRSMTLPQTISADGGRYANKDESFVFWSKGNGAFVTESDPNIQTYSNCVTK
ncbi:MAG: MliC family protein [Candidatus Pacebacteria bacterium]|nr:MliC family protein [Candidatus Paceibacterota bacterium]